MIRINPFGTVESYKEMVNKIASIIFVVSLLAVELLRRHITSLGDLVGNTSVNIKVVDIDFPIASVGIAFAVALISRVAKLHDRISSVFGIRRRFDLHHILQPMALHLGFEIPADRLGKLHERRSELMRNTFYAYATGTTGRESIDKHYITMALDQWSWYWIVLESLVIVIISALLMFFWGDRNWAFPLMCLAFLMLGALQLIRGACVEYARQQVVEIAADAQRRAAIREVFANAVSR